MPSSMRGDHCENCRLGSLPPGDRREIRAESMISWEAMHGRKDTARAFTGLIEQKRIDAAVGCGEIVMNNNCLVYKSPHDTPANEKIEREEQ